tara:strand:- start:259 stop:369 length:111 start_codon:yes stop_codon:yes gene_type:complete
LNNEGHQTISASPDDAATSSTLASAAWTATVEQEEM